MDAPRHSRETLTARPSFGASCVIPSPLAAEALGRSGLDWVFVDCQHGLIGLESMDAMLQALSATPALSLVRVPEGADWWIGRALDAGAGGVIVPMVNSAAEAQSAVRAARYPPLGGRSWGPTRVWSAAASTDPADSLLLVMIETREAAEAAHEIAEIDGVDGIFVGAADLTVSLGLQLGGAPDPTVRQHAARVARICRERGLIAAIGARTPEQASGWLDAGFTMLSIGRDLTILTEGLAERLAGLRGLRGETAEAEGPPD